MVIKEAIEYFRTINPESLECKNGERIRRPSKIVEEDLLRKKERFGSLNHKDEEMLKLI